MRDRIVILMNVDKIKKLEELKIYILVEVEAKTGNAKECSNESEREKQRSTMRTIRTTSQQKLGMPKIL
jgi:hypothetical protein